MVSGVILMVELPPERLPSLWLNSASRRRTLPVTADIARRMFCTLASPERVQFRDPRQTGKRRTVRRLKRASSLLVINWLRGLVRLDPKALSKPQHLHSPHPCGLPPRLPPRVALLPALPQAHRKRVARTKSP